MDMLSFLMTLPVLLPAVFWAVYHYHKDRHLPEPPGHLVLALFLGVLAYYLAGLGYQALELFGLRYDAFELALNHRLGLFAYAVLGIGVIEEAAKMIPFLAVVIHFREFDEPIDGIIYASFIALGFALMENLHYAQFLEGWAILARGFAGPVVHIVFASFWGYYIGRAWLCRRRFGITVVGALAFTAFVHGIYDYIVIALPPWALVGAAVIIAVLWLWRLHLIRDLHTLPEGRCPPGVLGEDEPA